MSTTLTGIDRAELRQRLTLGERVLPRPFLRWAGSKRLLLPQIMERLPASYGTYFEPFLGGASLFFLLRPSKAILADSASELVNAYQGVARDVETVMCHLDNLTPNSETFYKIRSNRSSESLRSAAEFIYLNKTCWNGLYRVNSKGQFNVPYGGPDSVKVYDAANLRACSRVLSKVSLRAGDFEDIVATARSGDLVFLDPPYVTKHNNNGFIDYNEKLFSWNDQIRLATVARSLALAGVHVVVTNAHHRDLIELYPGFEVAELSRSSTLAADSNKRGRVGEALFWTRTNHA